jgi:hypothetical protein
MRAISICRELNCLTVLFLRRAMETRYVTRSANHSAEAVIVDT